MKTMRNIMAVLACMIAFMIIFIIGGLIVTPQHIKADSLDSMFNECTQNNGGDWACDSCFKAVYGRYPDATTDNVY